MRISRRESMRKMKYVKILSVSLLLILSASSYAQKSMIYTEPDLEYKTGLEKFEKQ